MTRKEAGKIAGKKYGALNGRRAVESGQLVNAGRLAPLSENGKVQGRKNRESGHMQRIQQIGASLGGKVAAAAHPNHIFEITTYETRAKGGIASTHLRFHLNRSLFNPQCELCQRERKEKVWAATEPQGKNND